jgi:hypothetical protein
LAQVILRSKGFRIVDIKGNSLFQGEIIAKEEKYTEIFLKSSPEPAGQFHSNLVQNILG